MGNELAHQLSGEALRDLKQISPNNDSLNLVDIMKYEKLGPEQKRVGQFLQDNFSILHGISENEEPRQNAPITKSDLQYVNRYSQSDQTAIDDNIKLESIVTGALDGALAGAGAVLPILPIVGVSSFAIGPFAPALGVALDGAAAAAGYAAGSIGTTAFDNQVEAKVDKLKL